VVPLNAYHPVLTGSFSYMQFPGTEDVTFGDMVAIEELASNHYIEDEDETYLYRLAFERLLAESLDQRNSQELIEKYMHELWA